MNGLCGRQKTLFWKFQFHSILLRSLWYFFIFRISIWPVGLFPFDFYIHLTVCNNYIIPSPPVKPCMRFGLKIKYVNVLCFITPNTIESHVSIMMGAVCCHPSHHNCAPGMTGSSTLCPLLSLQTSNLKPQPREFQDRLTQLLYGVFMKHTLVNGGVTVC